MTYRVALALTALLATVGGCQYPQDVVVAPVRALEGAAKDLVVSS